MTDTTNPQAAPVCKFDEGCHRVAACDPGCAVTSARMHAQLAAAPSAPADRAAILREAADALVAVAGQHPEARAVVIHWGDAAALLRTMAQEECDELEAQAHLDELADDLSRMTDEAQQAESATTSTSWAGATELTPDRVITALAATGLVGYRQNSGRLLHCLAHKPAPASRYADFHEVTADDLDDGGICVHPDCGRDLLAPWPAAVSQPGKEA